MLFKWIAGIVPIIGVNILYIAILFKPKEMIFNIMWKILLIIWFILNNPNVF